MDKKENLKIIKQFGPSILKVKIPDDILNQINDYVENNYQLNKNSKND